MPTDRTLREKLDYLIRTTGRTEADIVAEAIVTGLTELYRKQVADTYRAGKLSRQQAVAELGEEAVQDLDSAVRKTFSGGRKRTNSRE